MDRLVQRNVLAMSGRAVEAAGDVDTLLLDKTGTITFGNRQADRAPPGRPASTRPSWPTAARLSSLADETPEGRCIVALCARPSTACAEATPAKLVGASSSRSPRRPGCRGSTSTAPGDPQGRRRARCWPGSASTAARRTSRAPSSTAIADEGGTPLVVAAREQRARPGCSA